MLIASEEIIIKLNTEVHCTLKSVTKIFGKTLKSWFDEKIVFLFCLTQSHVDAIGTLDWPFNVNETNFDLKLIIQLFDYYALIVGSFFRFASIYCLQSISTILLTALYLSSLYRQQPHHKHYHTEEIRQQYSTIHSPFFFFLFCLFRRKMWNGRTAKKKNQR